MMMMMMMYPYRGVGKYTNIWKFFFVTAKVTDEVMKIVVCTIMVENWYVITVRVFQITQTMCRS